MGPQSASPVSAILDRQNKKGNHMPILLWLVGIPIPLIILILLLR
jgi:hypothetical protein